MSLADAFGPAVYRFVREGDAHHALLYAGPMIGDEADHLQLALVNFSTDSMWSMQLGKSNLDQMHKQLYGGGVADWTAFAAELGSAFRSAEWLTERVGSLLKLRVTQDGTDDTPYAFDVPENSADRAVWTETLIRRLLSRAHDADGGSDPGMGALPPAKAEGTAAPARKRKPKVRGWHPGKQPRKAVPVKATQASNTSSQQPC